MEVSVKCQITNQSTINTMAYHPKIDLLVTAAANSDTCSFFTPSEDLQLQQKFINDTKPPGQISCLSWSPDGQYLALGHNKVEVWQLQNLKFSPFKTFNEDFIQVKNISWSSDSMRYICSGFNKSMQVHIRNVKTSELSIIKLDVLVFASLFDQFGKYIAILSCDNIIHIYDSTTLQPIKTINMAHTSEDLNSVKQRRILSWSPDYTLLASPNLNNLKVSSAVVFDRKKNFTVQNILIGHKTPINCLKFNPHIYQIQGEKTFILAVGDSSGTLSIWRIGTTKVYDQPLLITSSPYEADQSIEDMEWDLNGQKLFLHVMKKYIVIYQFKKDCFGSILSQFEKTEHIQKIFGVVGVTELTGKEFQIFGMQRMDIENDLEKKKVPQIQQKFSNMQVNQANQDSKVLIKTPQQTIMNGNKKKRIIPSRHVEEKKIIEETKKAEEMIKERQIIHLKIRPLKMKNKQVLSLNAENYIQVKNAGELSLLRILPKTLQQLQYLEQKKFQGEIVHISLIFKRVLAVNQNSLHILDNLLYPLDLPIHLGQISDFTANDEGDIYFMLTNGMIKGFNFIKKILLSEMSLTSLVSGQENQCIQNPLSLFKVYNNDESKLHIQLKSNTERYFFDHKLNNWIKLNFNSGFLAEGHSLRISRRELNNSDNFFQNLKSPPKISSKSSIMEYELQMLYYKQYSKNEEMYKATLKKMFCDLRNSGNDQELRKKIQQYFIDQRSSNYIEDRSVWEEIQKIGGSVIQQFSLMKLQNDMC